MRRARNLPVAASWIWVSVWTAFALLSQRQGFALEKALQFPNDAFGRNLFLLTGYASRGSLIFASVTVLITSSLALLLAGGIACAPSRARFLFERTLDFLIAFPSLLIALAGQAVLGGGSSTLVLSLAFGLLPSTVRFLLVRAREVLSEDYLLAARALGSPVAGILTRHLVPAMGDHLRLKLPFIFAQAIAIEATLSFLGLGASPGTATWGALLAQAKDYLVEAPYISMVVGLPLLFMLLALTTLEESSAQRKSQVS